MITQIRLLSLSLLLTIIFFACKKSPDAVVPPVIQPPAAVKLSYGDSIFYLQNQASDYIVLPTQAQAGVYSGFPEGIEIDPVTGAINVSKSETGLRYKISFKPAGATDSITTIILISGINFMDGFYKLTSADSIAKPVYNGNTANIVPGINNGSNFDEGSGCNSAGCTVNVSNGIINLAQTVRNGVFGTKPANNDRHEFVMNYRLNDKSNKNLNTLKIKLYYFETINDVTQEAYDIISSRLGTVFKPATPGGIITPFLANMLNKPVGKVAKPRPPCIFILAR